MAISYRRCPRCGFPLTAMDRYCGACGHRASRVCPRCEHEVPTELPYCNYCGQPLAPLDVEDPLPRAERVKLLYETEVKAFQGKVAELKMRQAQQRRRALRKRGVELAVFLLILVALVLWGAPAIDAHWKDVFAQSPGRSMVVSFLCSVLIVLAAGYILQVRQSHDNAEIEELRVRLFLARQRLEEAQEREDDWVRVHSEARDNKQEQKA